MDDEPSSRTLRARYLRLEDPLRDVQMLAGHSNIRTTQAYIEANPEAQERIVDLV